MIEYKEQELKDRYIDFSNKIQDLFIEEDSYIIDTGNFENVNDEMLRIINKRIERHPFIWKLFFKI